MAGLKKVFLNGRTHEYNDQYIIYKERRMSLTYNCVKNL